MSKPRSKTVRATPVPVEVPQLDPRALASSRLAVRFGLSPHLAVVVAELAFTVTDRWGRA